MGRTEPDSVVGPETDVILATALPRRRRGPRVGGETEVQAGPVNEEENATLGPEGTSGEGAAADGAVVTKADTLDAMATRSTRTDESPTDATIKGVIEVMLPTVVAPVVKEGTRPSEVKPVGA